MSREYYNILDIIPTLNKRWTVLLQVLEIGHTQVSKAKKKYRRLLFTDTKVK